MSNADKNPPHEIAVIPIKRKVAKGGFDLNLDEIASSEDNPAKTTPQFQKAQPQLPSAETPAPTPSLPASQQITQAPKTGRKKTIQEDLVNVAVRLPEEKRIALSIHAKRNRTTVQALFEQWVASILDKESQ